MTPPITVLMSIYNSAPWVSTSIKSIQNQTFGDFEFLIVNDGSTDDSAAIVKGFANKDSRIRLINKRHTGLADSLNIGIEIASGEWIARIDSDDFCDRKRLELQRQYINNNPLVVLLGSSSREIEETEATVKTYRYPSDHEALLDRLVKKRGFFPHSSAFIKTKVVRHLNGYRARIRRSQDYDLWLRLSEVGRIASVDEPLVTIRKHDQQVSHEDNGIRQLVDARVALVSYFLRASQFPDPVGEGSSENHFDDFRAFVEAQIIRDGIIPYRKFIEEVKKDLLQRPYFGIPLAAIRSARSPRYLIRYAQETLTGEQVSSRIAAAWIEKSLAYD